MPTGFTSSSIQVLDGTNDITSIIQFDSSFNIQSMLTKQKGQFTFNIKVPNAPTLPSNTPVIGDTIYVNYTINGNTQRIFGGTVVTIEPVVQGGLLLLYQVTAADWGYTFDAKVVKANYAGEDPHNIVTNLVSTYAPGFTTNHVEVGNFLVSTIQFNYQQLSKCLQALAQMIGWDWYIDPHKDIHFYFAEGNPGGSSEVIVGPIVVDDTTGDLLWNSLDIQIDITNMKNSIYVVGGTYAKDFVVDPNPNATPPQYDPVDVYTTVAGTFVYPLAYPYQQATMTVTLNGTGQSIGYDQQTDPSTVEVLYNNMGRFLRFTSDPGNGKTLIVQGEAQIPILAHVSNSASIALYGEYQDSIVDTKILSVQQAQERAQADIDMFGHPVYTVKFNTLSPVSNQLSIGQQLTINSAKFNVLAKTVIIKQINWVAYSPTVLLAQVQCLGSQTVNFNDIMLYLLQKDLASDATDTSSNVLQELIPIDESIEVTETITITGTAGPYVWAPEAEALQGAEGGAMYGSFGYGSSGYASGLPYADDAASGVTSPVIVWDYFTWT